MIVKIDRHRCRGNVIFIKRGKESKKEVAGVLCDPHISNYTGWGNMIAHSQISQQMCRCILHKKQVTEKPCWRSYWKRITIIKPVLHQGMCYYSKIKYRSTICPMPKKHKTIVLTFQILFIERMGVVLKN